jgi:hypothetical protein
MSKEIKISFEYDRINFHLGKEIFFLSKDKVFMLLDKTRMENEFERAASPDDLIGDMDTWQRVAELLFWRSRDSTLEQIAKSFVDPISVGKLKNWLSRSADYIEQIQKEKVADIKALISRFEAEYRPDRRERDLR